MTSGNTYNEAEVIRETDQFYKVVEEVDVKNLLNEEVEKSRNVLLIFTLFCVVIGLFGEVAVKFLGLSFSAKPIAEVGAKVFFICVALVLASYYLLNTQADHAHKMSGTKKLILLNRNFEKYLSRFIDDKYKKIKHTSNSKEISILHLDMKAAEDHLDWLKQFSKKFEKQAKWVQIMPVAISFGCIVFIFFSLFLYPYFEPSEGCLLYTSPSPRD